MALNIEPRQLPKIKSHLKDVIVKDLVLFVQKTAFLLHWRFGLRKRHDRHAMTFADQMRGGTVDDDFATAFFAGKDIRFETSAIRDGRYEYFFTGPQVDSTHQIRWNRDATFVVDISVCDSCAVKLGLKEGSEHILKSLLAGEASSNLPVRFLTVGSSCLSFVPRFNRNYHLTHEHDRPYARIPG